MPLDNFLYDLTLWVLAGAMAFGTSILLKWSIRAREKRAPVDTPFILFILIMMLAMVMSAVVYFLNPSTGLLLDLVVINMFVMSGGILPILLIMSLKLSASEFHDEPSGADSQASDFQVPNSQTSNPQTIEVAQPTNLRAKYGSLLIPFIVVLVLLNEFFMGWALMLASGTQFSSSSPLALVSSVVNSYWFIFTMSAEMALTAFFLRKEVNRTLLYIVGFQSVIMFLSPTAIADPSWVAAAVFGGSALMIALFIYMFEYMARNSAIDQNFAHYLFRVLVVYSMMMAGLFIWELYQSGILFSASIILEMIVYFYLILGRNSQSSPAKKSWLLDAKWTVALLSMIFIAEYFMGGLLDVQIYGTSFFASLNVLPLSGNALAIIEAVLYDFLVWFGAITGSVWFLIMMGIEMGSLVAFKIGTARELETKIRLVLVILAYAIYAILLPSFLIPTSRLPTIPFVGWSMGVGTAGAVAPDFLIAIIGTYVASGILSFLFGARQVCSMFCTASLMYQGTFYDKMKTFNRSSKTARKFLTTRLSNLYRVIFSVVWVSLFAAIAISYLDSIGVLNFSIFGSDPTQFLYLFYFNFLWYIAFVTIPFVGTYACVSMGWCHWGTFNQLVSRLGFFKLKVKSTDTCLHCPTKDCALACPVGLTDLPSQFISKGQLKSNKCIGVGDCVTSCPYENIQFHDIRHWVRGKFSKSKEINSKMNLIQLKTRLTEYQMESSM